MSMPCRARGFTLVELVAVMVIVTILAVVALPRVTDTQAFRDEGFRDAVVAAVSHARKAAIASRRFTCVQVTAGTGAAAGVALTRSLQMPEIFITEATSPVSVNCNGATLPLPARTPNCAANQVCAPTGVSIGGANATLIFDPIGQLVQQAGPRLLAANAQIATTNPITINAVTGGVQ